MKKVTRLRLAAEDTSNVGTTEQVGVRTTGRIKKPKAVFDPSDNYLPRSYRASTSAAAQLQATTAAAPAAAALERKRESEPTQSKRHSQSSGQSACSTVTLPVPPMPPVPTDTCYICLKKETKRGFGARNKLITCNGCEYKVHKMCLKLDFENLDTLRSKFKCDNCRTCILCSAFSEIDSGACRDFVTCTKCVTSYHLNCHIPNVHKYQQNINNWKCNKCTLPNTGSGNALAKQAIREIIGDEPVITAIVPAKQPIVNTAPAVEEPKPSVSKRTFQAKKHTPDAICNGNETEEKASGKMPKREETAANRSFLNEHFEIPDVKFWTVDQVTEYFRKYFPNEAYIFKEHEIDGMSLLLLKRSDVVKKLPIKLGPSLRIYSLILKIQTHLNDATLDFRVQIESEFFVSFNFDIKINDLKVFLFRSGEVLPQELKAAFLI